jgi:CBS domain-containing protein
MKVQDVCSRKVVTCTPDTTLAQAGWLMWEHDCGILPVVVGQKVTSVITDRDICVAAATKFRPAAEISVQEVTNGKLHTCRPDDDVRSALATMKMTKVRRLPVVEKDGTLAGLLSINDVIAAARPGKSAKAGDITCEEVVQTLQGIGKREPAAVAV